MQLIAHLNMRAYGPLNKAPQSRVRSHLTLPKTLTTSPKVMSVGKECEYNKSVKTAVKKHKTLHNESNVLRK